MERRSVTAEIRDRVRDVARRTAGLALIGVPAIRAALHGARIGAGRAFGPVVVRKLGVDVLPGAARALGDAIANATGEAGLVITRGGHVLRTGARELILHTRGGVQLRVTPSGARAAASESLVRDIARGSARAAWRGIGRATVYGAAAGAVLDGVAAGTNAYRAVQRGEMDGASALRHVGVHAARGAVVGATGVAAAGAVSVVVAASGLTLLGAPVVLPLATMVTAGALAGRAFDDVRARGFRFVNR
jgi:hypothetical protein